MGDNISSQNQSGGITAKSVNLAAGSSFAASPPARSRLWKLLAAILGALAAVAAILTYFGIVP